MYPDGGSADLEGISRNRPVIVAKTNSVTALSGPVGTVLIDAYLDRHRIVRRRQHLPTRPLNAHTRRQVEIIAALQDAAPAVDSGKSAGPRRSAKTTRVVHVHGNMRTYSARGLRWGGSSWASGSAGGGASAPRYVKSYRKRLDLGVGVHPSTSSLAFSYSSGATHSGSSPSAYNLSAPSTTCLSSEDVGRVRSLGFGSNAGDASANQGGIGTKLKFEFTENARAVERRKFEVHVSRGAGRRRGRAGGTGLWRSLKIIKMIEMIVNWVLMGPVGTEIWKMAKMITFSALHGTGAMQSISATMPLQ
ncbi:hypothetical protein B0H16DRAFT_1481185 [Mycena metata]|uniref:Uncharacterized protein n=1 Tax=Mycena metata TaxID=1033252 RepID=A0AAD7GZX4_9AGAR|nr:hypothetical protein B0H16DRAFT_1481185 [Mycena metata]